MLKANNPIKRVERVYLTLIESVDAIPKFLGSRMREMVKSSYTDGTKMKELWFSERDN